MLNILIRADWQGETKEQEWDFIYNNKRVSIEALDHIKLKSRGKGPEKKLYNSSTFECGPCYDPDNLHVHIWKKHSLIENFNGEQNQIIKDIQYTDYKAGTYCSICHKSAQKFHMRWREEPDSDKICEKNVYTCPYKPEDYLKKEEIATFHPTIRKKTTDLEISKARKRWRSAFLKIKYSNKNEKTIYPISPYKSLLLWPWEMTPYQKFKISQPNYKKSKIFIKNKLEEFKDSYAYIK